MDIFGIGAAELVIICLVILIVAGPKRSALWARQAGTYFRQFRLAWQEMMRDMQDQMGEETKEIVRAAQDLRNEVNQIRRVADPQQILGKSMMNEIKSPRQLSAPRTNNGATNESSDNGSRYGAWQFPSSPSVSAEDDTPSEDRYDAWKPSEN